MRWVITGGLGFIGSNFINYILENTDDISIVNVDSVTAVADFANIASTSDRYQFRKCDTSNFDLFKEIVRKEEPDIIVNFAAESHVDRSIDDSRSFIQSNIVGTHSLLEISRRYDLRFHHISTDEVFGDLKSVDEKGFTESSSYNPRNPYSATKAASDFLVRSYVNTYGVKATISISSNIYGPNQHIEKFVPKIIVKALSAQAIPLYGQGEQLRNWLYVFDYCSGVEKVLKNGRIGKTYLFGGPSIISNLDLVKLILDKMNLRDNLIHRVSDRPGHDFLYRIDSSSTSEELSWSPQFTLERGLDLTIEHFKTNISKYEEQIKRLEAAGWGW